MSWEFQRRWKTIFQNYSLLLYVTLKITAMKYISSSIFMGEALIFYNLQSFEKSASLGVNMHWQWPWKPKINLNSLARGISRVDQGNGA